MADVTHIYGNEIVDAAARQDIADLETTTNNLKDDFHEYHSELGAGYADQLVSSIENTDQTPYNFRKVPYDATLEQVEGIVGCDVVVNQLVQNGNFADASGWNGRFATVSVADGVATMTPESDGAQRGLFITSNGTTNANHKYFLHVFAKPAVDCRLDMSINGVNGASPKYVSMTANVWNDCGVIWTTASDYSSRMFYMLIVESLTTSQNVQYKTASICDLTAMFGTAIADYVYSLEQSTAGSGVAWLKKHFSKIFDAGYIAHNPGTMVHVSGLSAHKTVGFNQWDEEWEVGLISVSNGQNINGQGIRSKNMCECFPNTQYHARFNSGGSKYIFWYDVDGNFIYQNPVVSEQTFTSPDNARYFKIRVDTIINYNHDVCINLSDPAKNGTYEPYTMHEYPIDSTVDLHGILKLDSNNQLYADGDVYPPSGQVSHRYGEVDLGTLNWSYNSASQQFRAELPQSPKAYTASETPNAICTKYIAHSHSGLSNGQMSIYYASVNGINVIDSEYTDATAFKASLSGVLLVYEKATASTETVGPYTQTQICDPNGTEEYISDTVAPVGHVTKYPENLRKKIEELPWNFATLIAPTEAAFVATRNYTTGSLFIVNNVLYKATANIANGGAITPNSNCTATTLAEVISALS